MHTSSLAWPNMFSVSRNTVNVYEDSQSVVNRTRLMMLTEPTELFNDPDFGLGLKKYLWHYVSANNKAKIQEDLVAQLRLHEPCVIPDATQMSDGLLYTGSDTMSNTYANSEKLEVTFGLQTTFGDKLQINTADVQASVDSMNSSLT